MPAVSHGLSTSAAAEDLAFLAGAEPVALAGDGLMAGEVAEASSAFSAGAPRLPLRARWRSEVGKGSVAQSAAGTPRTVSGPETLHSTALSSLSNISSTCFRAASSSSGVNFFMSLPWPSSLFFAFGSSSLSPSLPSSPSRRRSSPRSSLRTSCASCLADSRLRRRAWRMKGMPMRPVVGSSPPCSSFLISFTVSFWALSTVSFTTPPRVPSSSESEPLSSAASESSD
mmetsp:Transcript_22961/g.52520  ORF Transcript_22961/g.52520 Transcript_22961/m.52520 type:complete len:228 (+) Transcript_22961:1195-1878(+)